MSLSMSLSMSSWHACLCATHSQEFSFLSASRVDNTRKSLYKIRYSEAQGSHAMTSSQILSKNACHGSYQGRGTHTHRSLEDLVTNNAHIEWFLLFSSKTNMVNSGRTSPTTHGRTHTLYTTTQSTSGHEDLSKHTATTFSIFCKQWHTIVSRCYRV